MAKRSSHRAHMYGKKEKTEGKQLKLHERIAQFELFNESIMEPLREMVLAGAPPSKIRQAYASLVQARMVQEAAQGNYQAMKDVLDRHEGTAVQRQESITRYAKMDKSELAALTLQKLKDAGIINVQAKRVKDGEKEE